MVVVDVIAYVVANEKLLLRIIIGLMKVLSKVTFLVLADELIIWILILLGKHCLTNSINQIHLGLLLLLIKVCP